MTQPYLLWTESGHEEQMSSHQNPYSLLSIEIIHSIYRRFITPIIGIPINKRVKWNVTRIFITAPMTIHIVMLPCNILMKFWFHKHLWQSNGNSIKMTDFERYLCAHKVAGNFICFIHTPLLVMTKGVEIKPIPQKTYDKILNTKIGL